MLEKEADNASKTAAETVQGLRDKISYISRKLERLTDLYVAENIEREDCLFRHRALMSERQTIEEQIIHLERAPAAGVEPVRDWIETASSLDKIAQKEDLLLKNPPSKKFSD